MGTLPRNRLGNLERDGNGYRRKRRGMSGRGLVVILAGLLAAIVAVFVLLPTVGGGLLRSMAEDNPDLIRLPLFADAVREQLGDRPDQPAGTDPRRSTSTSSRAQVRATSPINSLTAAWSPTAWRSPTS